MKMIVGRGTFHFNWPSVSETKYRGHKTDKRNNGKGSGSRMKQDHQERQRTVTDHSEKPVATRLRKAHLNRPKMRAMTTV